MNLFGCREVPDGRGWYGDIPPFFMYRYLFLSLCVLLLAALLMVEERTPYEFRLPDPSVMEDAPIHPTWFDATVTVYNPVESQCDDDPLVMACNEVIDLDLLKCGRLRYCAVSRDLLEEYAFGDTLELYIAPNHEYNGKWVIKDTMNARYTNCIDLLTYDRRYGKWEGQYIRR